MRATVIHGPLDVRVEDVLAGRLDPSPVFDLVVGLDAVPGGYAAMHERTARKVHVRP